MRLPDEFDWFEQVALEKSIIVITCTPCFYTMNVVTIDFCETVVPSSKQNNNNNKEIAVSSFPDL